MSSDSAVILSSLNDQTRRSRLWNQQKQQNLIELHADIIIPLVWPLEKQTRVQLSNEILFQFGKCLLKTYLCA
jgi:hypothetical protein